MLRCRICGCESSGQPLCRLPGFVFGRSAEVRRCPKCGVARTLPEPIVDTEYYAGTSHYEERFEEHQNLYRTFANHLLDFALDELTHRGQANGGLRMLDVGAGRGWLVEQANARGFQAVGVELNRQNVQTACRDGVPLYESVVDMRAATCGATFDVIVFSAVLEHVPDPVRFLRTFSGEARPGALVVVAQAAFDGLLPRIAPWLWYGWQPREHFWHFDEPSLASFLTRSGLCEINVRRTTLHHDFLWRGGFKQVIGKNLASSLGRIGQFFGQGDHLYGAGVVSAE